MDFKTRSKDMLASMIFLEIKKDGAKNVFGLDEKLIDKCGELYIPVDAAYISNNISNNDKLGNMPLSIFIEGMFLALGADSEFKYNHIYKVMLANLEGSLKHIKKYIADLIKEKKEDRAFIFMKGLISLEENEENVGKALILADNFREYDKSYKSEELELIEKLLSINSKNPIGYYYKSLILKDDSDFEGALFNINQYIAFGGEETSEIIQYKKWVSNIVNYDTAKEIIYEDPKGALELLLPLIEEYENNPLIYFNVAVAYRVLENFEKAIYYLNEAMAIDSAIVEIVNELGINYACLNDFETAILYFKKSFEVTKSVEICTNIVMCYMSLGKLEDAKIHLELAEKLDKNDEIVIDLKARLNSLQ